MKRMKKLAAALILVCWVAGAPLAVAGEGAPASSAGFFGFFGQWLGGLVEEFLGGAPPAPQSFGEPGDDPEVQMFIIPGG